MDLETEDSALHKLSSLQIFKIVDFVHIGYKLGVGVTFRLPPKMVVLAFSEKLQRTERVLVDT